MNKIDTQNRIPNVRIRAFAWTAAALFAAVLPASAKVDVEKLPKPTSYLSDYANVVDPVSQAAIEAYCSKVEKQLGVQFGVVTINTIEEEPIEDFGIRLFRQFKPGSSKDNQGALMILAIQDRKSDVEIGRGLEAFLNDAFVGDTLRSMRPALRAGDYGNAILQGLQTMGTEVAQGKNIQFDASAPIAQRRSVQHRQRGFNPLIFLIGFFAVMWLIGRIRGGRGGRGGSGGGYGGGGGGFLTGMILGQVLGGGRGGGGGWGGGGGFGGSDSGGGGGGFGGFGGGDAGGGGANSDW